jgi:hypothetical protein
MRGPKNPSGRRRRQACAPLKPLPVRGTGLREGKEMAARGISVIPSGPRLRLTVGHEGVGGSF